MSIISGGGIFTGLNEHIGRADWPPKDREAVWHDAELLAALLGSDDVRIRQEAGVAWNYPYVHTPLPRMLSRASTNMLFGDPPEFAPGDDNDNDAERLDFIVEENDLDAELQRAGLISSSEGEVFGRICVRPDLLDAPIIEFVSTRSVIPMFKGRFLVGCTFVTQWATSGTERVRRFEYYGPGIIQTTLYRGTATSLGSQIALDSFEETKGTPDTVNTGIDRALVAFIPNSIDVNPARGYSDYRGLEQRFLSINESVTTGQHNLELAGRKRALVDAAYLDQNGGLRKNDDLLIKRSRDATMGSASGKALEVLEYSFEAQQLIAWVEHMVDTTIMLSGFSPQDVGRSVDGGAVSGTALRLKRAHSLIESAGKGRHYKRGLATLLRYAAIIDSRRTTEGGFGRKWNMPDERPSIELADPMPRDEQEAAQRLVLLTNAEAISTEEKVRYLHPEWSEDQISEEVDRIGTATTPTMRETITTPAPGAPGAPGAPQPIPTLRPAIALPGGGA